MLIDPGLSLFGGSYGAASSIILLFWILLFLAEFMKRGPKPPRSRLGSVRTQSWGWFWCPSEAEPILALQGSEGDTGTAGRSLGNQRENMICCRQSWKWQSSDERHCYGNSIS